MPDEEQTAEEAAKKVDPNSPEGSKDSPATEEFVVVPPGTKLALANDRKDRKDSTE